MIMYFPGQAKSLGYQQVYLQPMLMNSYMYNVPKIKHTEQTTEKFCPYNMNTKFEPSFLYIWLP